MESATFCPNWNSQNTLWTPSYWTESVNGDTHCNDAVIPGIDHGKKCRLHHERAVQSVYSVRTDGISKAFAVQIACKRYVQFHTECQWKQKSVQNQTWSIAVNKGVQYRSLSNSTFRWSNQFFAVLKYSLKWMVSTFLNFLDFDTPLQWFNDP